MQDSSLPFFATSMDPGPSFMDLLRRVQPTALPSSTLETLRATQPGLQMPDIPHGTTVVAIRFADGVIMAGDRRATAGYSIAGRRMEKVQAADDYSGVAIAGSAGPALEMIRLFQTQLEHYEKVQGDQLSLEGKANQLSHMVRANLPAAMQGFVVVPIFAGFDHARSGGRVFTYDATGGRYEEIDYATSGSGSVHARNWVKGGWNEGLTADDAVSLAIRSLFAAADEDVATGGPDLVRRIYPTVAVIDANGYRALTDDDIEARSQALLGGPERGGERGVTS